MKGVQIKNLAKAWNARATHTRECKWTGPGDEKNCTCNFAKDSIYPYFKTDAIEMLLTYAKKVCAACAIKPPVKSGQGYYHTHNAPDEYEDWCEASALYLLADDLKES